MNLQLRLFLNKQIIDSCKNLVERNLGTLKDLPYELANTIANMYYKLLLFASDKISLSTSGDPIQLVIEYVKEYNRLKSDVLSIPEFVSNLREMKNSDEYDYACEYVIDCLKYDIENINFKTPAQRKAERGKKIINEIDNLVDILDI
ncbi:MAG: hypothetical protein ACOZFS_04420 [Thermodesulfobacteriota bacterium]